MAAPTRLTKAHQPKTTAMVVPSFKPGDAGIADAGEDENPNVEDVERSGDGMEEA